MLRSNFYLISRFVLLSSSLLIACDAVQLCGQYACVWYHDDCEKTHSCSAPRQCEAAGSIRDRAPRIINQLRNSQRSCGISSNPALTDTDTSALASQLASELIWDETLARISNSHASDMANNRFESFVGSDGFSTSQRVSLAGIDSLTVFESVTSGPQTAAEAINRWLDTNTDCQQLIHPNVTRVGMACAVTEFNQGGGPYWSLLLVGPEP